MLACLLAALGFLAAPMAMAADDVAIVGTLVSPDGKPVVGVAITVEAEGFSQAATTGADGKFSIPVPKGGTYQVTVDETTLPAGVTLANPDDASRSILVLNGQKRLLFKLSVGGESTNGSSDGAGTDTSDNGLVGQVSQLLVDGVLFGILIALGAVGLNLIFGTTGLTNFSHGELLTLGAFTAIVLNELGINILIAAPLAVVISALLFGWGQNKLLWKPLRRRRTGLIASMVVTIGLAITLRYTILLLFGGSPRSYQQFAGQAGFEIGPVSVTPKSLILAAIASVAIAATVLWLQRSRIGKATRAVSDNPALASATGIDVERVISVVWTLGAGLAAFAGIYLGLTQDVSWNMGQRLLLVMFAAVTLGGLGTIYGAIVGALVVGMFIQLSTLIIPTEMKTVGALFLMIVILLVRPQGILGRRERVG
ncbi:MAG: branched-chain amino acid ABC transporter permease [Actinobacteria bacterium]|nr:branched-chain amino acid ABC transporter permease [Actinomycetota bacterium]